MVDDGDLGFSWRRRGDGVQILRHGVAVTTLRGHAARDFVDEIEGIDSDSGQQLMARLTGSYKRGNERKAADHPRNRRET